MAWELEFYADGNGREPVREWLDDLDNIKQAAALRGLSVILANHGTEVIGTEYGTALGRGLFEFRLRFDAATILAKHDPSLLERFPEPSRGPVLLRVFCHAHDGKVILLLGAYDKGRDPSRRRQQEEIRIARKRLTEWDAQRRTSSFRLWWVRRVRRKPPGDKPSGIRP